MVGSVKNQKILRKIFTKFPQNYDSVSTILREGGQCVPIFPGTMITQNAKFAGSMSVYERIPKLSKSDLTKNVTYALSASARSFVLKIFVYFLRKIPEIC